MVAQPGQLEPLPGVGYPTGTISAWDIYQNYIGASGPTTSDRTLPGYAASSIRANAVGGRAETGLIGTPAGWFALALVALALLAWHWGAIKTP